MLKSKMSRRFFDFNGFLRIIYYVVCTHGFKINIIYNTIIIVVITV